jgi:hypothetical protein
MAFDRKQLDISDVCLEPADKEIWRVMRPDTFAVTFYGWPHADLFVAA